jgi:hypothetical protein
MGGTCGMHEGHKIQTCNLNGRGPSGDLGAGGKIILKWILMQ